MEVGIGKFILRFSIVGLVLPIVFSISWLAIGGIPWLYIYLGAILAIFQLILWPSSFLVIGMAGVLEQTSLFVFFISTILNILLYGLVGGLIWLGVKKNRIYLIFAVIFLFMIWYLLISWYYK